MRQTLSVALLASLLTVASVQARPWPTPAPAAIDPVKFNRDVAAWTALVYLIADSDIDFRAIATEPK